MKTVYRHRQIFIIYTLILCALFLFTTCINHQNKKQTSLQVIVQKQIADTITYSQFAGSAICASCHKEITDDYFHTVHYYTSQSASSQSIKGSFKKGENNFVYDVGKIVALEKKQDSFYQ